MSDPFRAPAHVDPAPPGPPPVSICTRCGVVAPAKASACEVCKTPLSETRGTAPSHAGDAYWVAVRCGFTCRQCNFVAPLDCLDDDGAVDCAHCGLRQRFEVDQWTTALEHAHKVGDLAGPYPEGRHPSPIVWIGSDNPLRSIGDTQTFSETTAGALQIEAAPGYPVCRRCHIPVAVSGGGGETKTSCSRCHDHATFLLSPNALKLSSALVAVIADETRTDKKVQPASYQSGLIALNCPGCGAPVSANEAERVHSCSFCKATYIIPARVFSRLHNQAPAPEVWWIMFRGPSAERKRLEAGEGPTNKDDSVAALLSKMKKKPAGEESLVTKAPEIPGRNWPQIALTAALGLVALVIGYLITGD